ncbi:MAG: right-handed parallel beta-helix repeat-containing protein [Phototrophicales bacterium]|nr:right-handed parallel beta-helix repeat-containing protein [Phototrophicales bacterium]
MRTFQKVLCVLILIITNTVIISAQSEFSTPPYDIGNHTLIDLYINPTTGDDNNDGVSPETAFLSLATAWRTIPMGETLTTGYRLNLADGIYPENLLPSYWESRYGTAQAPIIIQGAGANTLLAGNINVYDTYYIYFLNLTISYGADAFHCELCDHLLIRDVTMIGSDPEGYNTRETLKVNQSQYVYIENSDISGAGDNAIDFVAVQYGHILNNRVHNAGDWCAYVKGGSAYIRVEGNLFYDCGNGGFSAGQGTGFQFMTPPWLQYEVYFITIVNNIVTDAYGAGIGVQGGYNVLVAYNTLYNIGARSHLLEVVYGSRSCDGQIGDTDRIRCAEYLAMGGWGTEVVDDGDNYVRIPNKNVYIYNNILWGSPSPDQHFWIPAPYSGASQAGSGLPDVIVTDENLQIGGNIIWDGEVGHYMGVEYEAGCGDDNPTCNLTQLLADNTINSLMPSLIAPADGQFGRTPDGNVCSANTYQIPAFPSDDLPADIPAGDFNPQASLPVTCAGIWSGTDNSE